MQVPSTATVHELLGFVLPTQHGSCMLRYNISALDIISGWLVNLPAHTIYLVHQRTHKMAIVRVLRVNFQKRPMEVLAQI